MKLFRNENRYGSKQCFVECDFSSDTVVTLSESDWMAPMEARAHLNLSMDVCIQNFRRRRGLDPMTGDPING